MSLLEKQKIDGWNWLVSRRWWTFGHLDKLWFGNQIDRYVVKFKLGVNEERKLRHEIAVGGLKNTCKKKLFADNSFYGKILGESEEE